MKKNIVIVFILFSFIFNGCKDNPILEFSIPDIGCALQAVSESVAGGSGICMP